MIRRTWKVAAALCFVATVAACSKDSGHTPAAAGPSLSVTPSATSVVANGTGTVTLTVTDTGGAAVTVTTDRGTLNGGVTSYVVPAGTGATTAQVTLTTCNSGTNVGCAGAATVRATSTTGVATTSINFTSLGSACQTNCGADPGCANLACTLAAGGTGSCSATTPSSCTAAPACTKNPPTATTETNCMDGIDNDCNGKIDCADAPCDGQPCSTTSATSVCKAGKCTDLASGLAITVTPARTRLPADGVATTTVVVALTSGTTSAPSMGVTVSTTAGTLSAATGTTGADGTVSFTFTAPATAGVAVITARATLVPAVSASASVTMPRLGSIQIPTSYATHPIMGVRTSGWNEIGGVSVQVLDDLGQNYPDGLLVHFEHRQLGGSTFGQPLGTCAATSPAPCVAFDARIFGGAAQVDKTGLASAPLYSGTLAGTLDVTAATTAGGVTRTATLPGIAVVGAKASAANFSIQCSPRNVPALAETDCSTSWVDAPFTCVALLKDRFGNLLGTSTQVIFVSEAGAVGQVAWTPPYDPASQGGAQKNLGSATQIFQTLGAGLPFDVPPQVGEPSVVHGLDGCGSRTHNPRDGVVTIIAIADGEEGFYDANGNGQYDAAVGTTSGEPFIDQGEPFVDQNDNGVYDPGEWFLDVNGNGRYDGPNGTWDAQTKIWAQTVVVYTAAPATMVAGVGPTYLGTRWVAGASYTSACAATALPTFAVNATVTGPPLVPATSQPFVVVASDYNLNFLDTGSSYSVSVPAGEKVKAAYFGLPSYADGLGMTFRYWPCDQPAAPATPSCASQCRAPVGGATGTGPCLMTPTISGFWCGVSAPATITGGDAADPGTVEVDLNVQTPWNVYLGSKTAHAVQPIFGTNR